MGVYDKKFGWKKAKITRQKMVARLTPEYPYGNMIEPYDIEREKNLTK